MMEALSSPAAQKPLHILFVAVLFLACFLLLRFTEVGRGRRAAALLVPAACWAAYAAWELAVAAKTPVANVPVDLLILWPLLLVVSLWFAFQGLRPR
jgi:hypothetical protein